VVQKELRGFSNIYYGAEIGALGAFIKTMEVQRNPGNWNTLIMAID
jgi:hypothetical protein